MNDERRQELDEELRRRAAEADRELPPNAQGSLTPRGRGWRPNSPRPMTDARKRIFLENLAEHGIVGAAAAVASPHLASGGVACFNSLRRKDPEFAAAWDEALALARGKIEAELHRRAVEGWEEKVFWKGEEAGTIRKYSDRLLELRMAAIAPEYRKTTKIEHTGSVETDPGVGRLSAEKRQLMRQLLEGATDAEVAEPPLLGDDRGTSAESPG